MTTNWEAFCAVGYVQARVREFFCLSLPFMQCLEQQHPAFQRVIQTLRVSYRKSRISSDLMSCAGQRAPVCSSNPQPRERHCNWPSTHDPMAAFGSQTQLDYLYTSLYARPNAFVYFCEAIMENATENVWHLLNLFCSAVILFEHKRLKTKFKNNPSEECSIRGVILLISAFASHRIWIPKNSSSGRVWCMQISKCKPAFDATKSKESV